MLAQTWNSYSRKLLSSQRNDLQATVVLVVSLVTLGEIMSQSSEVDVVQKSALRNMDRAHRVNFMNECVLYPCTFLSWYTEICDLS